MMCRDSAMMVIVVLQPGVGSCDIAIYETVLAQEESEDKHRKHRR